MDKITKHDYFLKKITDNSIYKHNFLFSIFSLIKENTKNDFITVNGKDIIADDKYIITDGKINTALYKADDEFKVTPDICSNTDKPIVSTYGKFLVNKILFVLPFGNRIPYKNKSIDIGSIETEIVDIVMDPEVEISRYIKFVNNCSFIKGLSRLFTISATEKSILPAPGISAFKQKLIKEYDKKYKSAWRSEKDKIVKFEKELRDYDSKYLQDDPTQGIFNKGKVQQSRDKRFLTFGTNSGFGTGDTIQTILPSLSEGYGLDKQGLVDMYNNLRSGSYFRGNETQKGGTAAKDGLRATSDVYIEDKDCGSKLYRSVLVTDINKTTLIDRYILENNKLTLIKDVDKYLNKTIKIRDPLYCKSTTGLCRVCVGEIMGQYSTGISLLVTEISGAFLSISLSKFHGESLTVIEYDPHEALS